MLVEMAVAVCLALENCYLLITNSLHLMMHSPTTLLKITEVISMYRCVAKRFIQTINWLYECSAQNKSTVKPDQENRYSNRKYRDQH